jgi:hypothetical protein
MFFAMDTRSSRPEIELYGLLGKIMMVTPGGVTCCVFTYEVRNDVQHWRLRRSRDGKVLDKTPSLGAPGIKIRLISRMSKDSRKQITSGATSIYSLIAGAGGAVPRSEIKSG